MAHSLKPRHRLSALRNRRGAWTLIEILVVIAILGVIAGLSLTVLTQVRERANQITCFNNLKNLVLAVHSHHAAKKSMPPYASGQRNELIGSWFVHLLPYLGHQPVYDCLASGQRTQQGQFRLVSDGRYLPGVKGVIFPELICPSDPTRIATSIAPTNYLANWYAFTNAEKEVFHPAQRFEDLSDGLSNIVLFAEAYSQCDRLSRPALYSAHFHNFGITQQGKPSDDPSYAPKDYTLFQVQPAQCDKWRTQTPHRDMHVALGDGSVRPVSAGISLATWKNALKPRDGHPLGDDW